MMTAGQLSTIPRTEEVTMDPDSSTNERLLQLVDTATELVEANTALVLLRHGRKAPLTGPDGSWPVVTEPEQVQDAVESASKDGLVNVGVVLSPKLESHLVVVDYDGTEAGELRDLGVSSGDEVWISRTGCGGFHIFYYIDHCPPPRVIGAGQLPVDLLSDGFAVIPPSNTYREPKGGGPYYWVRGHSPTDIPLAELRTPPASLLEWWY